MCGYQECQRSRPSKGSNALSNNYQAARRNALSRFDEEDRRLREALRELIILRKNVNIAAKSFVPNHSLNQTRKRSNQVLDALYKTTASQFQRKGKEKTLGSDDN
ncbi:hypothetical protein ACTXT7_004493 [Hymenolepis weldensis]